MSGTGEKAAIQAWLARLQAPAGAAVSMLPLGLRGAFLPAALAGLVAAAMESGRSLLLLTRDDEALPDLSNAIDIDRRPLCLVLPGADYANRIALRATLSLLKSRLTRASSQDEDAVWVAQRQRLADLDDLWHACLSWSGRGLDDEPWPEDMTDLFPVRILPLALADRLRITADWTVVVTTATREQGSVVSEAWPGTRRTLHLVDFGAAAGGLVAADPRARLRGELELLTQELAELELELATAQAEIAGFTERYHSLIGSRLTRLDQLKAELAERRAAAEPDDLEAGKAAAAARSRAEQSSREHGRWSSREPDRPAQNFAPSGDIKKLFRKVAQKIHPDRAHSEADRAWRTQLMSEANRAYRAGDETALREVMSLWQEGDRRDRAVETDAERLEAQVAALRRRVAEIEGELNRLFGSRLYELFTAAQIASRSQRDLLQEMADRLDADIAAAESLLAPIN